jgi:hypothetical protein
MLNFRPRLPAFIMLAVAFLFSFGCTTVPDQPNQNQQLLINTAVDVAVAIAIQNGTNDPATWKARANQIVHITEQLEAVAAGDTATVKTVVDALQPLLIKAQLSPPEMIAAARLSDALAHEIAVRVDPDSPEIVLLRKVLAEVKYSANFYTN